VQSKSQQTTANKIKALFDRRVIHVFQHCKVDKFAAMPFICREETWPFIESTKTAAIMQNAGNSSWGSPNLKNSNDPDHVGFQITSISSKHILVG